MNTLLIYGCSYSWLMTLFGLSMHSLLSIANTTTLMNYSSMTLSFLKSTGNTGSMDNNNNKNIKGM